MTVSINTKHYLVFIWPPGEERTEHELSRKGINLLFVHLLDVAVLVRGWEATGEYIFEVTL